MLMNEVPKINFKKTNKIIKSIDNFIKSGNITFSINYSNKDILQMFLLDSLTKVNYIESIDYSIISENEYSELSSFVSNDEKFENIFEVLKFISDNELTFNKKYLFIIDGSNTNNDILTLCQRIKTNNIKFIYINNNLLSPDLNIPSTFDFNDENDIRSFITKSCNIDQKKLTRLITNFVYNELESSNNKIDILNKYQIMFNDIENILLDNITKAQTKIEKDDIEDNKKLLDEFEDEIEQDIDIDSEDEIIRSSMKKPLIFSLLGLIIGVVSFIIFF